jgi:asparagine synthase (glutamine-hydrolysing)
MSEPEEASSTAAWIAAFGEERPAPSGASSGNGNRTAPADRPARPGNRGLYLHDAPAGRLPALAQGEGCRVIFDGILHNRDELRARFASRLPCDPADADLVRLAYQDWAGDALLRLRGFFALIIWDSARDRLLCARDPVGLHPLFYADAGRTLLLSPSIEALLGHAGVSRELNRPGLVDHLAKRWLNGDETYFARVRRVPPCHVVRVHGNTRSVYRYWDPAPPSEATEWIPDDEAQERFEERLEQAVARCLAIGPAGINLSGGLDSSTVAMVAADLCRRQGRGNPWALSLVLPGPHVDEAVAQQAVATALDLPHLQLPFDEATGPRGALAATLDLSRTTPAPVSSVLRPALSRIALEGGQRGCRVILTGDGADEWVAGNPHLAGDLLRSLDLKGMYQLWRILSRSFPATVEIPLHSIFWRWGARPLLRDALYASPAWALARSVAPGALEDLRRRRMARTKPPWIAPDPALGAEIDRRETESWERVHAYPKIPGFSLRFARSMLDLPQKWMFHEETFHLARRVGVHEAQPFWDADLIDLMMKIRPQLRARDGLTKSLMRGPLTRRFPELGFERRLKSYTGNAILSALTAGTAEARHAMGGTWVLAELGLVDPDQVTALLDRALAGTEDREWVQVWDILNLETWVRAHYETRD